MNIVLNSFGNIIGSDFLKPKYFIFLLTYPFLNVSKLNKHKYKRDTNQMSDNGAKRLMNSNISEHNGHM